jgi:hypothetical protein
MATGRRAGDRAEEVVVARERTGGTRTQRWAVGALAFAGAAATAAGACAPQRSVERFCEQLKVVQDLDLVLAGGAATSVAERAGQLEELRLAAPEAIEPQVGRLVAVTDDLARTMGTAPDPDTAASDVFSRRRAELPEITAAGRAVEAYAAEHCQVQLNPAAAASTTMPPVPPVTSATTTTRPAAPSTKRPATTTRPATTRRAPATTRRPATTRKPAPTSTRPRAATTTTRRR